MYGPNHHLPEAALQLNISRTTLRRMIREGEIVAVKLGTSRNARVVVPQSSIDEFLKAHVTAPAQGGAA